MSNITPVSAPSHLAFPMHDIAATRVSYGGTLGCPGGRSPPGWVNFNFCSYQIVAYLTPGEIDHHKTSAVDGDNVLVCHFGVISSMSEWEAATDKLRITDIRLIIKLHIRFKGKVGRQAMMLFLDPSGNAIEVKAFANMVSLLAK